MASAGRTPPGGLRLFVLFFVAGNEARRGTKRFAVVEYRKIANVEREGASGALLIDNDRHRAALDAIPEADAAATSETCVRETLQHRLRIILQEGLDLALQLLLRRGPDMAPADGAVPPDED